MNFETIKTDVLYEDGSLRDIVIKGTSRRVYHDLCDVLSSEGIAYQIEIDGGNTTLSEALGQFDRGADRLLPLIRFNVGSVCIVAHFFDEAEVEMDFVPSEIKSESGWQELLRLQRLMSERFHQTMAICPENDHTKRLFEITAQQAAGPNAQ